MGGPHLYRMLNFLRVLSEWDSIMLEGSILKDLGVISLIIIGRFPIDYAIHRHWSVWVVYWATRPPEKYLLGPQPSVYSPAIHCEHSISCITSAHALSTNVAFFTIVCTGNDFKTSCLCRFYSFLPSCRRCLTALLYYLFDPRLTLVTLKESVRTARLTRRVCYKACQRMVSLFWGS
jgi:hypothetical protein